MLAAISVGAMPCARALASPTLGNICVTHQREIEPATGTEGFSNSNVFDAASWKSAGAFISSLMRWLRTAIPSQRPP